MNLIPWYRKTEMIIGLSALVVSLVAVCVGVYSAYLDRAFARASIWPKVEIHSLYSSSQKKFIYRIENVGTGPALIKYTKIKYKSKVVRDWTELTQLLGHKTREFSTASIGSRVLPALATINPLVSENESLAETLNKQRSSIKVEICFCSVFDQCWLTKAGDTTESVASCEVESNQVFLD